MAEIKKPHLESKEERELYKMRRKRLGFFSFLMIVIFSLLGGAIGGVLGFRFLLPSVVDFSFFDGIRSDDENPQQVTIERTETVRVEEPLQYTDAVSKMAPSLVSVFSQSDFVELADGVGEYRGGSAGFVLASDGLIVAEADRISSLDESVVMFTNGDLFDVVDYFVDEKYEIAFLRIDADNLTPVDDVDFQSVMPGSRSLVFSGRGDFVDAFESMSYQSFLFGGDVYSQIFSLSRYPESRTGVVSTVDGKASGLLVEKVIDDSFRQFVVSLDVIKEISNMAVVDGRVQRKSVDFTYREIDAEFASVNSLDQERGAYVVSLIQENSNFVVGDIVVSINNVLIDENESLESILFDVAVDERLVFSVIRNGQQIEIVEE